jgi:hypothetical protein
MGLLKTQVLCMIVGEFLDRIFESEFGLNKNKHDFSDPSFLYRVGFFAVVQVFIIYSSLNSVPSLLRESEIV